MKKMQNKLFNFKSFLFYIFVILITVLFSASLVEQFANGFLISHVSSRGLVSDKIIEVVVDDYSNQKYKWEKDTYADLLDYFYTYTESQVIGFDFTPTTFGTEVDKSEEKFIKQVSRMDNLVFGFAPERVPNGEDDEIMQDFKKHSLNVNVNDDYRDFFYNGIKSASPALRKATHNYGSVIYSRELKSWVLEVPNLIRISDNYYPSLGFKMYLMTNNTNDIVLNRDSIYVPKTNLNIKYQYSLGEGAYYSLIRYYKLKEDGYTYPVISASQIIDTYMMLKSGITPQNHPELYDYKKGKLVDPSIFKDKAVFIGSNITGPSEVVLKTPMRSRHPGVDIHATVYNNLMNAHMLQFQVSGSHFYYSLFCVFLLLFLFCAGIFFKVC